jgi:tetratricopeptide (TPR) repeat protein
MQKLCFIALTLLATTIISNAQTEILRRGDALVAQEKYELAIEEYERVSTHDRAAYAKAIYNIGVCRYELWQTDQAIAFYKRAIELKAGDYPRASYSLGVALEDQNKTNEAQRAYEQAVRASHGEFARATYRLGVLEAKAGEFAKAAAFFREAAAHAGEHVPASHNNLGVMLARLGFMKDAEREFLIALKAADGRYDDANHNLNLCRGLLLSRFGFVFFLHVDVAAARHPRFFRERIQDRLKYISVLELEARDAADFRIGILELNRQVTNLRLYETSRPTVERHVARDGRGRRPLLLSIREG